MFGEKTAIVRSKGIIYLSIFTGQQHCCRTKERGLRLSAAPVFMMLWLLSTGDRCKLIISSPAEKSMTSIWSSLSSVERRKAGVESAVYSGAWHRRKQRIYSTLLINITIRQMSCHCWLMDGFKDAKELIALFTFVFLHFFWGFCCVCKINLCLQKFQKIPENSKKINHHHHNLIKVR